MKAKHPVPGCPDCKGVGAITGPDGTERVCEFCEEMSDVLADILFLAKRLQDRLNRPT